MVRWTPGVRQRLEHVALALYAERGYEATTVADIATAAGVTPRTYFRQFVDKREVLFGNAEAMRARIVAGAEQSGASGVWSVMLEALAASEDLFSITDRDDLARRSAVIASAPELQEREARKLQLIADSVVGVLVRRGTESAVARVVADLGMVVFVEASRLWREDAAASFASCVAAAAARVRGIIDGQESA